MVESNQTAEMYEEINKDIRPLNFSMEDNFFPFGSVFAFSFQKIFVFFDVFGVFWFRSPKWKVINKNRFIMQNSEYE